MKKLNKELSNNKNNHYYLMRHGESLANRRGLIVSAPENAINGYGLTTKGADQVTQSALNTRLDRETIIISSDYKRARETAEIMQSVVDCHAEIVLDQRLRERGFGRWELEDDCNYGLVWQNDLTTPNTSINEVETVEETLSRSTSLIKHLEEQYLERNILLVSHGDVLQILLAHHHGINPRFHRSLTAMGNTHIRSLSKLTIGVKSPAA